VTALFALIFVKGHGLRDVVTVSLLSILGA
jgi:hypothetical protein